MENLPRIEDWIFYNGSIHGRVYNYAPAADGTAILTSSVKILDLVENRVTTRNSTYLLGTQRNLHMTVLAQIYE